jgi:hypothetical protein
MDFASDDPFPTFLRQCLLLLVSLLDDALIVGLSRLGCNIPWLEALSPIVVGCTTLYLVVQFWRHGLPSLVAAWQEFQQQDAEALET